VEPTSQVTSRSEMAIDVVTFFTVLDIAAIATSLVAAALWYQAGARTVRRISRNETLDAADLNRMVVGTCQRL